VIDWGWVLPFVIIQIFAIPLIIERTCEYVKEKRENKIHLQRMIAYYDREQEVSNQLIEIYEKYSKQGEK
jgi:hypothetical protein